MSNWINTLEDPFILQNHFSSFDDPLDKEDSIIDIFIPTLNNKSNFKKLNVIIETSSREMLFKGQMINGQIMAKIGSDKINHPGWRSRLTLKVENGLAKNLNITGSIRINVSY